MASHKLLRIEHKEGRLVATWFCACGDSGASRGDEFLSAKDVAEDAHTTHAAYAISYNKEKQG